MEQLKEHIKQFWHLPISFKAFYYLLFLTLGNTFFYYIRPIINAAGLSGSADKVLSIFWIVGIYFCLSMIFKSIRLIDIVAYLAICSFYYLSPTIYPNTRYFVESTFSFYAFQALPFYFLALMIDFHRDKTAFDIISKLQLMMTALFVLLSLLRLINSSTTGEQMALSYFVLFPTMFTFYTYSITKSKIDLLFFILGLSMILMFGTRGPLVCLIFYLVVFFFYNYKHNTKLTINLLLVIGVFYLFLHPIMVVLMFITRMVGLSTQIYEHYFEEAMFDYEKSSGRNEIHELLWSHISNDTGGIGYGLGSDRLMGRTGTEYAHNIIYEIWMDFGIYFGSLLLLLLGILFIYTLKKSFRNDTFYLFLMFFSLGFVRNLISGSYLQDYQFYLLVGYCINILRSENTSKFEDSEEYYYFVSPENNIDTNKST